MKLAIAILNWNGLRHLQTFLPSVVEHSGKHGIFVIDNASNDDSVLWIKKNYPTVSIIQNTENEGFCKGYNLGLSKIEAEYYVLLNSDVEVTAGWIDPILDTMDQNQSISACQPKILSYANKKSFEYAGGGGGFIDWLGYPFCRGRVFDSLEEDKGQYNDIAELFWASGACFFVRSNIFHELGGFDEAFFAHMEEIDLCWRMKNRGHQIMYVGESTVYHVGGGTLQQTSPFKSYLNFRNGLFLLYKNLPKKRLFSTLFIRLFLDGVAAVRHFLKMEFEFVWVVLKAHIHFYNYILKKKVVRDNLKGKETRPMLYKSIVWEYFAKGRKTYSELMS